MKFKKWMSGIALSLFAALAIMLFLVNAAPVSAQQRSIHRPDLSVWPRRDRVSPKSDATATPNGKIENQNHDVRYNVVTIGVLPGKTNTNLTNSGRSVNHLGDVTGFSFVYTGNFNSIFLTNQGFIWHKGNLTALPLLNGYPGAFAVAINDLGQVVGEASLIDSSGQVRETAVRWDHGQVTNLGTLKPNSNSSTSDINNWGAAVGLSYSFDDNQDLPVVWYGGTIHALPLLPGEIDGEAFQINDLGLIIGHQFW
jgi:probable HAF family extracellular repeat protein